MPAPNQRLALNSTAGWAQHEAQKKREERERARAFDEFRQVRLERTRREGEKKLRAKAAEKARWAAEIERRKTESKIEETWKQVQREHTLKFFDDLRTQEVQHMLRRHQEKRAWSLMDNTWDDPKLLAERARIANQTNPTAELLRRRIEEEKMEAAQLEMSSRASSAGSYSARRKEKVALEKQKKGEAKASSRLMQEDAAHNHGVMTERKAEKAVARRAAGEVERDLNVEYLNIDTRVAKWEEICFHEKDDEKDWRWPFSLDWSWLIRGDRVLHDERFVGLTPRDKRRTEQRLASERSTPKTTPRRGSVSSTPRSQVSV